MGWYHWPHGDKILTYLFMRNTFTRCNTRCYIKIRSKQRENMKESLNLYKNLMGKHLHLVEFTRWKIKRKTDGRRHHIHDKFGNTKPGTIKEA